eukprot:s287_g4.t2
MLRRGVPEDYVDALLDESYMQQLIVATGKQNRKRQRQRDRQNRLQNVILTCLICQAVLGVWVALYKTFLQPDTIISAFVTMENIDMVLMMDTSNHMKERRDQQHQVVKSFSKDMHEAMQRQREGTLQQLVDRVEELKLNSSTAFSRFLGNIFSTNKPQDHTGLSGGRLRFSTGIFNRPSLIFRDAEARHLLVGMTAKKASSVKTSKVPNRDRSRYEDQFVKTKLCSFYDARLSQPAFEKGKCTRGAQCTFAHGSFELQQLPDLTKTSLCPALMQFGACDDGACLFAHGVEELRATTKILGEIQKHRKSAILEDPSLSSLFDGADSVYRQDSSVSSTSCPASTFRQMPSMDLDQDDVESAGWPLWLNMSASARPAACHPQQYFQSQKESARLSPPWVSDLSKMPAHSVLCGPSWQKEQAFCELEQRLDGPPGLPRGTSHRSGGSYDATLSFAHAFPNSQKLHDFTSNLTLQQEALATVTADHYEYFTHLNEAMSRCVETFQQVKKPSTIKYCVLIGDNEAMCQKPAAKRVDDFCNLPQNRDLCPPELANVGSPIEYAYEFDSCKDFVTTQFNDIKLIMMFTVSSKEDEQMRLRNPTFRNFVQNTTGCEMQPVSRVEDKNGYKTTVVEYVAKEDTPQSRQNCLHFILGHGLDDVLEKSKSIVELLKFTGQEFEEPNSQKDMRYISFLLLPLILFAYLGASAIARWYASFQHKAARVMGKKKKMIKVTKTLVEKPARRASSVDRFAAQLTEVELAEVSNLRPLVKLGSPMTVRARLKGGHLRQSPQGVADGNGTPFDPNAFWTFEPTTGEQAADMMMEAKQAVHIKNGRGDLLCIRENGETHFLPPAEAAATGRRAAEFLVSSMSGAEESPARLGENVRIMSAATQKYLRVKKEGDCDANGSPSETETQFVIDQGGQAAATGGIFTFRSEATTDALLHGNPNGSAQII